MLHTFGVQVGKWILQDRSQECGLAAADPGAAEEGDVEAQKRLATESMRHGRMYLVAGKEFNLSYHNRDVYIHI